MKKVFAVVLAMIMVLAMGVTSFAASITTVWGGDTETEPLDFTWFDQYGMSTTKTFCLLRMTVAISPC
jgi:hypothetical protein